MFNLLINPLWFFCAQLLILQQFLSVSRHYQLFISLFEIRMSTVPIFYQVQLLSIIFYYYITKSDRVMSQHQPLFPTQKQNYTQSLSNAQSNSNSPTKQSKQQKQMRKLKVDLADKIFQLKKMEEDFAQEKAHIFMHHTQEKIHLNNIIKELKIKMADENQHWSKKFDELRLENNGVVQALNREWQARVTKQVVKQTQIIKLKYQSQVKNLTQQLQLLSQTLSTTQSTTESKITTLAQSHKNQVQSLKQAHQQQMVQLTKRHIQNQELKLTAIMNIKNIEQKEHEKTKNILLRRERQYAEQVAKLQERVFELNQQIWVLSKRNTELEAITIQLRSVMERMQKNKIENYQISTKQYEDKLNKNTQQWKQNLQSLNQKWKTQYKKVQSAYQKLSQAYDQKEQLWQERGNKVLKLYQLRQARQQDVKLIQHLQVQLIKKQFELEREKQELKCCKLELDNMDDIYKRIFHSVKKNRGSNSFHLKKMKLPGIGNKSTHPVKEM